MEIVTRMSMLVRGWWDELSPGQWLGQGRASAGNGAPQSEGQRLLRRYRQALDEGGKNQDMSKLFSSIIKITAWLLSPN